MHYLARNALKRQRPEYSLLVRSTIPWAKKPTNLRKKIFSTMKCLPGTAFGSSTSRTDSEMTRFESPSEPHPPGRLARREGIALYHTCGGAIQAKRKLLSATTLNSELEKICSMRCGKFERITTPMTISHGGGSMQYALIRPMAQKRRSKFR